MTAMSKPEYEAMPVEFKLNGKDVVAYGHETIIQTAKRLGIEVPHLCYKEACVQTATAGHAWSRSRASACLHHHAVASQRQAWK
jgi:hypothetical protein